MLKLAATSVVALLAISTTARERANASQPSPVPRAHCYNYGVTDWSGFYAGAHLGVGFRKGSDDTETLSVRGGGGGGGGGALQKTDFDRNLPTSESSAGGGGGGGNGAMGGEGLTLKDTGMPDDDFSGNGGRNNGGGGAGGSVDGLDLDKLSGKDDNGAGGDGELNGVRQPGADFGANASNARGGGGGNGGNGGTRLGGGGGGSGTGGIFGGGGGANGRTASVTSAGPDDRTVLAGLHAGYNWQCGRLLLGVEGDWTAMEQPSNYLTSLRARAGMVRGNSLFYITAGLAWTRLDDTGTTFGVSAGGGNGGTRGGGTTTEVNPGEIFIGGRGGEGTATKAIPAIDPGSATSEIGFVVGGGIETKLNDRTSVGLEALYYGFDASDATFDPDTFVVRARLTSHFSRRETADETPIQWRGLYVGLNTGGLFAAGGTLTDWDTVNGRDGGSGGKPFADPMSGETEAYDTPGGGGGSGAAAALAFSDKSYGLIGAHVGWNWQRGRWVLGLEGGLSAVEERFNYLGTLRGRIGLARQRSLFYFTGGLAFAKASKTTTGGTLTVTSGQNGQDGIQLENPLNPNNAALIDQNGNGGAGGTASFEPNSNGSDIETALVLGGGMEVKLRDNLSIGIEGLYYFFDDKSSRVDVINSSTGDSYSVGGDEDGFYTVKARLTYHFGHREQEGASEPLK